MPPLPSPPFLVPLPTSRQANLLLAVLSITPGNGKGFLSVREITNSVSFLYRTFSCLVCRSYHSDQHNYDTVL